MDICHLTIVEVVLYLRNLDFLTKFGDFFLLNYEEESPQFPNEGDPQASQRIKAGLFW